jgi:Fic family protein
LRVSLRRGALATTAIEGNSLSEQDMDSLEGGACLPPGRQYLQKEVENILAALNLLLRELVEEGKQELISPGLIKRFHALVGKDLGEAYGEAGRFRRKNVIVGNYRPPSFERVEDLVTRFSSWLSREFHYTGGQNFDDAVIEAIVSHIYMVWIHPFLDGNGRTARLVEFYLLLRAGVPDIASHLLSNHYNATREEYYRLLQNAAETGELADFILYALTGFRDGLEHDVLKVIHDDQIDMTWKNYVHDITEAMQRTGEKNEKVVRRVRQLAYYLPHDRLVPLNEVKTADIAIHQAYEGFTRPTLRNDLELLVKHKLVIAQDGAYRSNKEILRIFMPAGADAGAGERKHGE